MKRILLLSTAIALGLILWGLNKSPQFNLRVKSSTKTITVPQVALSSVEIKKEKLKFEKLVTELEQIKAQYQTQLSQYKKLDKDFTALIMKSRKNPNRSLIQKKQAELDAEFEALSLALKNYQQKSAEIYKFESLSTSEKGA